MHNEVEIAVEVEKPRYTYAQFLQSQKKPAGSVGSLIERFIAEMELPGMKKLGSTHEYSLRAIVRRSIGMKPAATLKRSDFIAYARERRQAVKPATVNQDITNIAGVLKYASSAWEDCEAVGEAVAQLEAAKPFLHKHNLCAKATPRNRVATDEEVVQMLDYFTVHPGRKLRMPDFIAAGLTTTRRRGELCRFMHGDIDWHRKDAEGHPTPMYMIRDLKHPTKKDGNHKWFPLFPEFAEIILRQPRKDPNDPEERVFPFVKESVTQSFIIAKKAIAAATGNDAILTLRLHDSRRRAITMWLAKLKSPHKVKLISGHETTHILERVYDATKPDTLHADMRGA